MESIRTTRRFSVDCIKIDVNRFRSIIYRVCPEFVIDEWNRPLMNDLYDYANGKDGRLDPNKGLLLWGDIGTGKSTIIKILGEVLRPKGEGYLTVSCSYLATRFTALGIEALNSSTYNETEMGTRPVNRAFDELGREPIPARHYGNELNIMQYILQCRYEIRHKVKTFATTNINPKNLGKLYGGYIEDRINEMFNEVELAGKSRRNKL